MVNNDGELVDTILVWSRGPSIFKVATADSFESHYPFELALSYGLSHGLFALGKLTNDGQHFPIHVTQAALPDILRLREQVWRRS